MGKINAIQNAILELDGGNYQKFMDAYLFKKYKFENIQPLGSHTGTNKVTKGIPDSYVKLENDKYILIMYGTVENTTFAKIEKDILSCLDKNKVDIANERIERIICCHTSTNLHIEQQELLENLCPGIKIQLIGIGTVSHDLLIKYPNIASNDLNIPIDTGQIHNIDDFIKTYDKNGRNAPLDINLLHRENETKSILELIEQNNIVLVSGKSGIGKTKLTLEVCRLYKEKCNINVLCIKNNGLMLYEDLKYYLSIPGKYMLFVDDANQTTQLSHILDYIINPPDNISVKLIMTVRDYAKERLIKVINSKSIYKEYILQSLHNDNIKDILKNSLRIINDDYLKQIIKISEGNIRLAILAGKTSIQDGYVAINNVTDIYSNYYGIFLNKGANNIKKVISAFIISLFGPFKYKECKAAIKLLEKFDIHENDFFIICHELNDNEIIDLFMEQVVKISDQSLGNYLLYYTLIEKKYISITEILEYGFITNKKRIIYALNTIISLFNSEETRNYIEEQINLAWNKVFNEENELNYVESFHSINEERALSFIKRRIDLIQSETFNLLSFDFDSQKNNHTINSKLMKILGGFKYSDNYDIVLGLILLYFSKRPYDVMDIFFIFTDSLGFDKYSHKYEYSLEHKNINVIWKASNNGLNINYTLLLIRVISKYLGYEFEFTEGGEGHSINFVRFNLLMCDGLMNLRKSMWEILSLLLKNAIYKPHIEKILLNYNCYPDGDKDIQVFARDLKLIENSLLNIDELPNIKLCIFMMKLIKACERTNIDVPEFLYQYKLNEDFIIYHTLTNYEITEDWKKEEKIRKENIYNLVKNYGQEEFEHLFNLCKIFQDGKHNNDWGLITGIDIVFEAIKYNNSQYILAVKAYMKCDTPYCNRAIEIISILIDKVGLVETESIISNYSYETKNMWLFEYIGLIPENKINKHHIKTIYKAIDEEIKKENPVLPNVVNLHKYKKIDVNIVNNITNIVLKKVQKSRFIIRNFLGTVHNEKDAKMIIEIYSTDLILLENLYTAGIQYNDYIDYGGLLFKKLVQNNKDFLKIVIMENSYDLPDSLMHIIRKLWEFDDYDELINISYETIMDGLAQNKMYIAFYHLDKLFVSSSNVVKEIVKKRQKQWIKDYLSKNYTDKDKMKTIFTIISTVFISDKIDFILFFINLNSDISIFKELSLFPNHLTWSGSQVPLIEKDIQFLKKLNEIVDGIEYIEHRSYIKERILAYEKYKKEILVREYLQDFDFA